jgi:aspartate/methionine/tyrosine aminotransferase
VIAGKVLELKKSGVSVIDAGQGSPTFTPERNVVIERVLKATSGETRYAPTEGEEKYRKKVLPYVKHLLSAGQPDLEPEFTADQLAFTVGGSGGVFLASMLVGQPDSKILIPRPGYSNYPGPVRFTEATLGHYETRREEGYIPNYDDLKNAVDPDGSGKSNVSAILFNFPGNPTGSTLTRDKAKKLGDTINKLVENYPHLLIVNDLAYLGVSREGENFSFYPFLSDQAKMNTVSVFSASKDASLANDRTGLAASINSDIMQNIKKICAATTMGINAIGTAGYAEAGELYTDFPNIQDQAVQHYQARLKVIAEGLNDIALKVTGGQHKVTETTPGGGIFIYANFSHLLGKQIPEEMREIIKHDKIESSMDIATILLNLHKVGYAPVAVIPGEGFGDDPKNCSLRIAGIESPQLLEQLVTSFKGMTQLVTGANLGAEKNYEAVSEIIKKEALNSRAGREQVDLLREAAERASALASKSR